MIKKGDEIVFINHHGVEESIKYMGPDLSCAFNTLTRSLFKTKAKQIVSISDQVWAPAVSNAQERKERRKTNVRKVKKSRNKR